MATRTASRPWAVVAVGILIVLISLMLFLSAGKAAAKKETEKKESESSSSAPAITAPVESAAPIAECTTPCSLYVGWDMKIKTGGRPGLVRFFGKKEWIPLSGRDDDHFTLDQFAPGEANFRSPSTPIQVQLFRAG